MGVHLWKPGDEVVAHCLSVELESPDGHNDTMMDPEQRIWGFETNFGGLAEIALVKSNQLMPKPAHLTWEEAAAPGLVNSTAYRQLVSRNGAGMKQGDNVLIWGASGGLGGFATQYALNGGAVPVCVVSSEEKAGICRAMGAELIINRAEAGYRFWKDERTQDPKEWRRFGSDIRELTGGEDVDIVFEHPGRETFGASVYAARKGGTIVTCASTSGYLHEYDNRYLWMNLKRIIGSHFANYRESWEANRLIAKGMIHPDALEHLPPGRGRPGGARRAPQPPPGQGRRAVPGTRGGSRRPRRGDARASPGRDQRFPRHLRRAGVEAPHPIGHTGPLIDSLREDPHTMSDQGLSIFDEPDGEGADEQPTKVMKAQGQDESATASKTKREPAAPAVESDDTTTSGEAEQGEEPAPVEEPLVVEKPQAPAPAAAAATGGRPLPPTHAPQPTRTTPAAQSAQPSFATVRRGGYDKAAVDAQVRQLLQDRSGVSSALAQSEQRVRELETSLEAAQRDLAENANPSYAGLGGRASAMLRLAEEEAAEIRAAGHNDADEIREQATRDALGIRADATKEADDMRLVQLQELDEMRARHHGRLRTGALARPERGPGHARRGQARERAAPARGRAGDQGAAGHRSARGRAGPGQRRPRGAGGAPYPRRREGAAGSRGQRAPRHGHVRDQAPRRGGRAAGRGRRGRGRARRPPRRTPTVNRPRPRPRRCWPGPAARPSRSSPRRAPRPMRWRRPATPSRSGTSRPSRPRWTG